MDSDIPGPRISINAWLLQQIISKRERAILRRNHLYETNYLTIKKLLYEGKLPTQCSICLDDIHNEVHQTTCGHIFHESCINAWFETSNVCPLCRTTLHSTSTLTLTPRSFRAFPADITHDNLLALIPVDESTVLDALDQLLNPISPPRRWTGWILAESPHLSSGTPPV